VLIVPFASGTVIVRVVLPEIPEHSNATFLEASELSFTLKTLSANSGLLIYPAPLVIALLFKEIFAEPSNDTPAIVLAVSNAVAVAELPVQEPDEPEALPVKFPTNPLEACTAPLKVAFPVSLTSKFKTFIRLPPSVPAIFISPSLISFTRLIVFPLPP